MLVGGNRDYMGCWQVVEFFFILIFLHIFSKFKACLSRIWKAFIDQVLY